MSCNAQNSAGHPSRPAPWAALSLALLSLAATTVAPTADAASFRGLGGFPGEPTETILVGMNPDGSQLVGRGLIKNNAPAGLYAFDYDEATLAFDPGVPDLPGGELASRGVDQRTGLAGLLRFTVGDSDATNGRRIWLRQEDLGGGESTSLLPAHPVVGADMRARGVARTRRVIGETTWGSPPTSERFYYDPGPGQFTPLPHLEVDAIDDAGRRIVGSLLDPGSGHEQALLWDQTRGAIGLGTLPGGSTSRARGISPSGRIVVGTSQSSLADPEAFRWHPDLGMHPLEPIAPGESRTSGALATSDANVVVGWYDKGGARAAFLWTPLLGRVDLRNHLASSYGLGTELSGWQLTEASEISADGRIIAGNGINPRGEPEAWVVDLEGPDVAEVRLRPIDPDGFPSVWELHLACGDRAISQLYFGVVPPQSFVPGESFFDFGGCTQPEGNLRFCNGANDIGPNVSPSSFVVEPGPETPPPARTDTIYLHLIGAGGSSGSLLCEPGSPETYLGLLRLPERTPELVLSDFDGLTGLDGGQAPLPDDALRLVRERPDPKGAALFVRPAPDDDGGDRWLVTFDSDTAFASFSFGLVMPPGSDEVSFGSCTEPVGPDRRRVCNGGDGLGQDVDFQAVRTVGPSTNLAQFGLRTDTLYVYLAGALSGVAELPALNLPGQTTRLGVFRFDSPPFQNLGFVPTLSFEKLELLDDYWSDIEEWTDGNGGNVQTFALISSGGFGGSGDPDTDGDCLVDAEDRCPYVNTDPGGLCTPDNADGGTLEQVGGVLVASSTPDGIGDACQCGAARDNPDVVDLDIDLLRSALADPTVAAGLSASSRAKCNSLGPVLGTVDAATGLAMDCKANDVFALLKGRIGETPMIPTPGEFPTCPDVGTP
jgi:hypothetical protein